MRCSHQTRQHSGGTVLVHASAAMQKLLILLDRARALCRNTCTCTMLQVYYIYMHEMLTEVDL